MAAYAFMPQMHGRYLLFPATVGAVMIGAGLGFALLDVLLIALAWLAIAVLMTGSGGWGRPFQDLVGPDWEPTVRLLVQNTSPDTAWMIGLIALILFYAAIIPSRPLHVRRRLRLARDWARNSMSRHRPRDVTPSPSPDHQSS
jgi:hypothetical protein